MEGLEYNEKILWEYIIEFRKINSYAPTIKEMCIGLNTKSVTWISELLDRLEAKDYISRGTRQSARSITIIKFPKK